jgi:hypothetical protein
LDTTEPCSLPSSDEPSSDLTNPATCPSDTAGSTCAVIPARSLRASLEGGATHTLAILPSPLDAVAQTHPHILPTAGNSKMIDRFRLAVWHLSGPYSASFLHGPNVQVRVLLEDLSPATELAHVPLLLLPLILSHSRAGARTSLTASVKETRRDLDCQRL